jgi:DNA processing protein
MRPRSKRCRRCKARWAMNIPRPNPTDTTRSSDKELQACRSLFLYLKNSELIEEKAQQTHTWCREQGAQILYPGHTDYPSAHMGLENPPAFLACWGTAPWKNQDCIGVVGSRDPSLAAIDWLEIHLSSFLRQNSVVVVSGGARGIDQKAHFLAIRAGLPTVVFLPSGLARPYPCEWLGWRDQVLKAGGSVISHYEPMQEIRRRHFEARNLLIAAMGKVLFVAEARRKSGTIMTARLARDLGREVCVLPGSPSDPRCGGSVDLLFDGAHPIRDSQDLAALFALQSIPGAP